MREERIVFIVGFAEAVAGVEGDAVTFNACGECGIETLQEAAFYHRQNFTFLERAKASPVGGAASGVHEDEAAFEAGACGGHFGVPCEAANIVDDFDSGGDCGLGGGGFPGIDGEQRVGLRFEDGLDDGKDAALFFFRSDRRVLAGASGFAADVDDVGSLLEHAEGIGCGCSGIEEAAAVGE